MEHVNATHKAIFYWLIASLLCISSCSVKGVYAPMKHKDLQIHTIDQKEKPVFSLFLLGDAGKYSENSLCFSTLKKQIEESEKAFTLVLGDNIYPEGMPPKNTEGRKEAELALLSQYDAIKSSPFLFIPGNHDWAEGSKEGIQHVKEEQTFLESLDSTINPFEPDDACPFFSEDKGAFQLVVINTQWWLHPDKPKNCAIQSDQEFWNALDTILGSLDPSRPVVVAGHHLLYSNGSHGGRYPFKAHLFPLTDIKKNLYIPLPILGTIYVLYRKAGNIQDIPHKRYQALKKGLEQRFSGFNQLYYVAGHEHSLQYHPRPYYHHIVSGSGSKTNPILRGKEAAFAYSGLGFARIDFYTEGKPRLHYFGHKKSKNPIKHLMSFKLK